jgi:cytosine/adenosine deaminase-related metal-dependent hydrolase
LPLLSPGQSLGSVVHSVRASDPAELAEIHAEAVTRGLPFHIHVEEQRQEIAECRAAYGMNPMELLVNTIGRAERVTAIHCTHTDPDDRRAFLNAGGTICLCPLTEANLGDGLPSLDGMLRTGSASAPIPTADRPGGRDALAGTDNDQRESRGALGTGRRADAAAAATAVVIR